MRQMQAQKNGIEPTRPGQSGTGEIHLAVQSRARYGILNQYGIFNQQLPLCILF
jgi:hypothetical protein